MVLVFPELLAEFWLDGRFEAFKVDLDCVASRRYPVPLNDAQDKFTTDYPYFILRGCQRKPLFLVFDVTFFSPTWKDMNKGGIYMTM